MQRLLMECAMRAALIALGTAAVLGLLRVKSAGARHAAWTAVVALMLLLPVWIAWGPRASLRVLPAAPAPAVAAPIVLANPIPPAQSRGAFPAVRPEPLNWLSILYFSGVAILLVRLALGTLRAHVLLRRAVQLNGRLTSRLCSAPVTVGWLRPAMVLPDCWTSWPQAQLDAVLTHEGEHVRRKDPLAQWLALLNRAIFWFHPLAWWLERRLSALAEEACDAAVLQRGHDPRDYSGYLLELARSVSQSGARVNLVGMAMPGSSLPRRIRQILARGPAPRVTRARALCLAVACATLSAVFAAATVDRQDAVPQPPLPPPPPAHLAELAPAPPPPPAVPPPAAAHVYEFPPPPPPPPPALEPAGSPAPEPEQPPPPPPQRFAAYRLIVLYFDLGGVPAELQARATATGAAFVKNQMQPNDLVAIMTANPGVKVVEDFTGDRDRLVAVLGKLSFDSSSGAGGLDRLLNATKMLRPLPQKKALIYFTTPELRQLAGPAQLQTLIDAAQSANVAYYPIDISALVTDRK